MQSTETEDRWYVDVGGTPTMMTLDELVESFEKGVITAQTLVTEVGGSEWKPLKEVADLGEEEEASPPSLPQPPVSQRVTAAPVSAFPPVATASIAPMASRESAWPPAAAWSQAPAPRPSVAPVSSIGPISTVPVVQDLSIGLDDEPFQKRRSKLPFIAAAAVIILGGAGFAASKSISAAPAPIPAPAAEPISFQKTVVTPIPTSEPAAPAPAAEKSDSEKSDAKAGLSDEVKAKLLTADKERDAKKKSARGKGARSAPRAKSGGSGVFRSGGDASDPLNSKL